MKKVLLSAFALGAGLMAMAQNIAISDTIKDGNSNFPFIASNYAYDDLGAATEYASPDAEVSTAGIYMFGSPLKDNGFEAVKGERVACEGQSFIITQPVTRYEPFGVSFGDSNGDGSGTPYTIDITNDWTLELTLYNPSDTTYTVRAAIQDVTNLIYDHNSAQEQVQVTLAPGETKTIVADYEGGKYIDFDAEGCGAGCNVTGLDPTKIKGINITVISGNNHWDAANGYSINGKEIVVKSVKLGNTSDIESTCGEVGLFGSMDIATFEVFPNPASDVVNLGEAAINAVLYNAQGIPVFSAATAKEIPVVNLEAGVYLLQAENGRAKIVVE